MPDILFAYTKVWDNVTGEILACLQGYMTPITIETTSHEMRVFMYTDYTVRDRGFSAQYRAVYHEGKKKLECSQCSMVMTNNVGCAVANTYF